jgi:hypothetical protein
MAYITAEMKAQIAPAIKAICKKYNIKATLAIKHHSALDMNISAGSIDFIGNYNALVATDYTGRKERIDCEYMQVNQYHLASSFTGRALDFLNEVNVALNVLNHDNSDIMTDYFDVGYYVHINIGKWDKPYVCTAKELA